MANALGLSASGGKSRSSLEHYSNQVFNQSFICTLTVQASATGIFVNGRTGI